MCMEDVRIGRVTTGRSGSTNISSAAAQRLLGASQLRYSVVISPPNGQRVTIAFGQIPVLDLGLTLPSGSQPIVLTLHDLGNMIGQEIWAIVSGAAPLDVGWIETSFSEHDL